MRDTLNIIPLILTGILHVAIFAGMVFAYDSSTPVLPLVPLAIKGTLVSAESLKNLPPIIEEVIEPKPEPEPEPDNSEQLRIEAEERKLRDDLRIERERIAREDAADRQRKLDEAKQRKQREEAEAERRRQAAERKRQEDVERQRAENERSRKAAEDEERQSQLNLEIAAEQRVIDAMKAGAMARYQYALNQSIARHWIKPASTPPSLSCVVSVRQLPNGEVMSVVINSCNGDERVRRSILAAVKIASPLPLPHENELFDRNLRIIFETPE